MTAPNPGDIYECPDGKLWLLLRADKTSALLLVGDGTHGTPTVYLPWTELTGTFRPGGVSGLHRGARAICHYLGMRPGGYITGYHRMLFDTAAELLAFAEVRSGGCPHGDPMCPCRDGFDDLCHYEGDDPAPCPRTRALGCDCRAVAA